MTVNQLSVAGVGTLANLGTFGATGTVRSVSAMANAWYDIDTGTSWTPFIGGGFGLTHLTLEVDRLGAASSTFDESDTVMAYQLGAGVGYKLSTTTTLSLSYRYFGTTDPEFSVNGETVESEYGSHNVLMGFSYSF